MLFSEMPLCSRSRISERAEESITPDSSTSWLSSVTSASAVLLEVAVEEDCAEATGMASGKRNNPAAPGTASRPAMAREAATREEEFTGFMQPTLTEIYPSSG